MIISVVTRQVAISEKYFSVKSRGVDCVTTKMNAPDRYELFVLPDGVKK
jgi:hypothetical protein